MSARTPVVDPRHQLARLPVVTGVVGWLLLDRLQADAVWFGVWWGVLGLWTLAALYALGQSERRVPVWQNRPDTVRRNGGRGRQEQNR